MMRIGGRGTRVGEGAEVGMKRWRRVPGKWITEMLSGRVDDEREERQEEEA